MKRFLASISCILIFTSCGPRFAPTLLQGETEATPSFRSTRWLDGRPKLILNPENQPQGFTHDNLARAWIKQEAGKFGISPRLDTIRLERTRRSAHGIHYTFVTPDGSGAVKNSVLIVSVTSDGSKIYRAYNGLDPQAASSSKPAELRVSKDQAIRLVWDHLRVTGKLLRAPTASLVTDLVAGVRKQWWIVNLETTAPAGSWEYWVDPTSGIVVKHIDRRVYHVSLDQARHELKARTAQKSRLISFDNIVTNGSASLFKVDPRSALNSSTLTDDSPEEAFESAYERVSLENIAKTPEGFQLIGKRVNLNDWDSPFTGVSKSVDGNWTAQRGETAFNDTMTWWHLDQAVKSMERLGFHDETRIFEGALVADPDGFDGQDNSFYTPTINALSFGHGCVDDNEDPDVILHEMGHAINAAINPYWQDGDTGAMGEGFGDYWAVSYGYADPRNKTSDRFRVFNWDGSSGCWDGRRTDRADARYKRGTQYHAHDRGSDGIISDEIWSTPLVMTLDELLSKGVNKDEVDLIVLESQFGLAHGLTMNDWANALVQTASLLFPNGPHAETFARHFHNHLIITAPSPELIYSKKFFVNAGKNGVPDPGETLGLNLEVLNIGDFAAQSVTAKLTSKSEWITVSTPDSVYGEIPEMGRITASSPFTITIHPDVACGKLSQVEVELTDGNTHKKIIPLEFSLGIPGAEVDSAKVAPDLAIPDHDQKGIVSTIDVKLGEDAVIQQGFSVDVAIKHPSVTDVKIVLITPNGQELVLKSLLSGERTDRDIIGNYPTTLHPVEELAMLDGTSINGTWTLKVVDGFEGGKGRLLGWGIRNPTGRALCER